MKGEWPLNSMVTLCTFSAACFKINFPTLVDPVIDIFLTTSESISCDAISAGSPESIFTVPSGNPTSFIMSINVMTDPGVITSGLQIIEQPAPKAVEIFLEAKIHGKFQGTKPTTTPTGS